MWTFVLHRAGRYDQADQPQPDRFRLPTLAVRIGMVPMEAGSLVMERRMLVGTSSVPSVSSAGRPLDYSDQ